MIYTTQPKDFNSIFDVVGCFCEFEEKILLLLRQDTRPQGNTWGIPSGKIDDKESFATAMQRELMEETGINASGKDIQYLGKVFVKYPTYDFIYHMFKAKFEQRPNVQISNEEHKEFQWINPQAAKALKNQIEDLDACISLYYK